MTDTKHRKTHSLSSVSSSSNRNNNKVKVKPSITKTSTGHRRSQRRRTNVLSSTTSSSLSPMILHENGSISESFSDTNDSQHIDKQSSLVSTNKFVFNTTLTTTNSKLLYWIVTDRQPEWNKLSIPINQSILNNKNQLVPYKKLSKTLQINKSNSNNNDLIDQPTDPTQLIMKAVMHELDYDMDDDDLKFLHELNHNNKMKQKRQISEEEFENAIIILEFSTAEKIRAYLKQKSCEDETIVCDICLLPDGDDGNEMVFCERCHCCVHQNCYGIPVIPSGTWLCKPCSILRRPACILCPRLGGPMKSTASGTIWCHLTCVLWLPELKFVDYTNMEPILNINKIPHARWSLRCVVCSTTEGACVQCAHKNCRTPFHVTCGLIAGYFLDIQQTPCKESATSRSQFNAYCAKHSDEARKRSEQDPSILSTNKDSEDDSSCSSSLPSTMPLTVYRRHQLKNEQWINECYKKFFTFISSSHLHEECPHEYDENLSRKIYEYWINKRKINKTMPLIKHIDFVLEQRENSELLITHINTCLKYRQTMLQLQTRCKSMVDSPASSSTLLQRLESLKKAFSTPIHHHHHHYRRRRRLHSSSTLHSSHGKNNHKNETKKKSFKQRRRKVFYSTEQHQTIEQSKRCIVTLESSYRNNLELNTTYLIGKTTEGQIILVPKQLIEPDNIITITDNIILQQQEPNIMPSMNYSDMSIDSNDDDDDDDDNDENDIEPLTKKGTFKTTKTAYTSQGNVVTCVTGSFD
ncbi:unnamed protein product [Rotaria sp. Silwood1]|nr:unnamed protein product [Rotaria sp. Silwood1]CAF3340017.1 unnamed protein product [Rotaria sp. Silwood1]CAF4595594.1 unnamed protein product [Rotaria sp. Silwood1]